VSGAILRTHASERAQQHAGRSAGPPLSFAGASRYHFALHLNSGQKPFQLDPLLLCFYRSQRVLRHLATSLCASGRAVVVRRDAGVAAAGGLRCSALCRHRRTLPHSPAEPAAARFASM